MTLIVAPWKMSDFEGAGIDRPGIEHLGFKVEKVERLKKELAALRENDPEMRERIIAEPSEGERRTALISGCRHGRHVTSSPDGVFVDVYQGRCEIPMTVALRKPRGKASKTKRARYASCKMDELAKKLGKWDPQAIWRVFPVLTGLAIACWLIPSGFPRSRLV